VRHLDDGVHDSGIIRVGSLIAHKRLVDLELVNVKTFEVLQAEIASAEINDGKVDSALLEVFDASQYVVQF